MELPSASDAARIGLLLASACSLAGDLVPIVAFKTTRAIRNSVTARLVTFFAIADAIGQTAICCAAAYHSIILDKTFCTLQAAANWYSVWASWGWTVAFAHVVRFTFKRTMLSPQLTHHPGHLDAVGKIIEVRWHVVCWLVPLATTILFIALGLFVLREDSDEGMPLPVCSLKQLPLMFASTPLFVALGYNAFAFWTVDRMMHDSVYASSDYVGSENRAAIARRLRPRFTLYILTFLVSQTPEVVVSFIARAHPKLAGRHDALSVASTATMILSQLHGFFNGVVFVWVNRGLCKGCCNLGDEPRLIPQFVGRNLLGMRALSRRSSHVLTSPLYTADYSQGTTPRPSQQVS